MTVLAATDLLAANQRKPVREQIALFVAVTVPFLAVVSAAPMWSAWKLSWGIAVLTISFYAISMLGITVGFHRLFTHRAFRANRALKICLAVAGSLAIQGPLQRWVADHRRHHAFADREGDPHSPWRFGNGMFAVLKGMGFAHLGWLFDRSETNSDVFAADVAADGDLVIISRLFGLFVVASVALPPSIELALGASASHVLAALFWASLVRIFMVHHVTWSINSICHVIGDRPFSTRDRATNFWPLAILSMGEAWHNGHHASPGCARHGVERGQIDASAWLIRAFERLGWATNVKWPERYRYTLRESGA